MYGITVAYTSSQLMLQKFIMKFSILYAFFFLERKNGTVSGKAVTQRNEVRWRSTEQGSIMIPGFRLATKLVSIHLCLKEHPYRSSPNIGCKDRKIKQKCSSRHVGPVMPPLMSLARRP